MYSSIFDQIGFVLSFSGIQMNQNRTLRERGMTFAQQSRRHIFLQSLEAFACTTLL